MTRKGMVGRRVVPALARVVGTRTARGSRGGRAGGRLGVVMVLALLLAAAGGLGAQEPLSIDRFEGWQSWALYEPGDLELDAEALRSQITWFDARFASGDEDVVRADVFADVYFKGEPAFWIQHTSAGREGDVDGGSVIDATLTSRKTFRALVRVAAQPGERTWGGTYDITHHHPDRVVRVQVSDDGGVEADSLAVEDNNPFDFVVMPYMLSFMELEPGRRFRLMNIGGRSNLKPRPVGMYVKGRTMYADARGREHEVWEVQLLNNAETLLVSLYVTAEAPFFWGWELRRVANGQRIAVLTYRDHTVL